MNGFAFKTTAAIFAFIATAFSSSLILADTISETSASGCMSCHRSVVHTDKHAKQTHTKQPIQKIKIDPAD